MGFLLQVTVTVDDLTKIPWLFQKKKLTEVNYDIKDLELVELQKRMERQRGALGKFSVSCLHFTDHFGQTGLVTTISKRVLQGGTKIIGKGS